jgi:peptide/nickel transport system substrate-binding protein
VVSAKRLIGATAVLLTWTLSLTACSVGGHDSDSDLVVGVTLEPPTLDLTMSDAAGIPQVLLYNVYETLVRMGDDGEIEPLLATSYELLDDGLTYQFDLDPEARFTSGTVVDAAAVKASIDLMSQGTSKLVTAAMEQIESVSVVDADTVAIRLKQPSNFWLYSMTSTPGVIFDPAINDLANTPMGSGPYTVESWTKGDRITLMRNDSYWAAQPQFKQVSFRYIPDPNAMVSAMLSGGIDVMAEMTSPDALGQFDDANRFTISSGTTNGEIVMGFNHDRPALQDLRVRQAIAYAIDRQALVDATWGGQGQVIGSMSVPTDPYYQDLTGIYPYDPAKARTLLASAGVADLQLALRIPITPYGGPAANDIATHLAEVGITVTVEELDFSSRWLPEVYTDGDYDMTIVAHVEARDIVNFANPDYYWHYRNPEFADLIDQADHGSSGDFVPTMEQAARLLADDAAAEFLFVFPNLVVCRSGIIGIPRNATSLSFDVSRISAA